MSRCLLLGCLLVALAAPSVGQSVAMGDLACLPLEDNAALTADIGADQAGSRVRLFFRRLNPVGGFYSVEMHPSGGGAYWTVFPKPEQREQPELTDEWWELLKDRDWMQGHDRDWLENWLEAQRHEAAEYYVATYDAAGQVSARSETQLVEVRGDPDEKRGEQEEEGGSPDCALPPLDMKQSGWAQNLTVGETTAEQAGEPVFHWLCDGIVTRLNSQGVFRADEYCRACVVGAFPVAAIAAGVVSGAIIEHEEASPRQP